MHVTTNRKRNSSRPLQSMTCTVLVYLQMTRDSPIKNENRKHYIDLNSFNTDLRFERTSPLWHLPRWWDWFYDQPFARLNSNCKLYNCNRINLNVLVLELALNLVCIPDSVERKHVRPLRLVKSQWHLHSNGSSSTQLYNYMYMAHVAKNKTRHVAAAFLLISLIIISTNHRHRRCHCHSLSSSPEMSPSTPLSPPSQQPLHQSIITTRNTHAFARSQCITGWLLLKMFRLFLKILLGVVYPQTLT